MADRAKQISELPTTTSVAANATFVVVDNTTAVANTKQISANNLFNNSSFNVTLSNTAILSANTIVIRNNQTPANSTITVSKGTIFFDTDYLYIAVANNTLKRILLTSF